MDEFYKTTMGHKFFEVTLPSLVRAIEHGVAAQSKLAEALEEQNRLKRLEIDRQVQKENACLPGPHGPGGRT